MGTFKFTLLGSSPKSKGISSSAPDCQDGFKYSMKMLSLQFLQMIFVLLRMFGSIYVTKCAPCNRKVASFWFKIEAVNRRGQEEAFPPFCRVCVL
jgi:hypothetical protein